MVTHHRSPVNLVEKHVERRARPTFRELEEEIHIAKADNR